ncbi:hypothetical protein [Bifidobacterium sp. UTBIF-78]|nr:hypothetical protein [Bifidobacterium sp. UTBIF-78]
MKLTGAEAESSIIEEMDYQLAVGRDMVRVPHIQRVWPPANSP